jgi:subtilisin family serine protease
LNSNASGSGIKIAVMDTFPMIGPSTPHPGALNALGHPMVTFENWVDPAWDVHSLYAPLACNGRTEPPYDVSSHGLFVAGIVRELAPEAEIRIYRVLSYHGVGDMGNLLNALNSALAWAGGGRLVVNMSLGFGPLLPATPGLLADAADFYNLPGALAKAVQSLHIDRRKSDFNDLVTAGYLPASGEPHFLKELAVLDYLFDLRNYPGSGVLPVAAAGNDCCGDNPPFAPRLPAAVLGVLAVSAFKPYVGGSWSREDYSNEDDLIAGNEGIGAWGGDLSSTGYAVANPTGSIVGPFVVTPAGTAAGTVMRAYWSGTSFASPVVAGFAAALWSDNPGLAPDDVRARIKAASTTQAGSTDQYLEFRQVL